MISTELQRMLWGDRDESFYEAHPTVHRTPPMSKADALDGLESGWMYFRPVPSIILGNTKRDCARSFNALVVDIDREPGVDPEALLAAASRKLPDDLHPTCAVSSGHRGIHLYWKLGDDLPIRRVEHCNRALAVLLGGDSCHDCAHFFRSPGTVHPKTGRRCEIIEFTGEVHPLDCLDHLVLEIPPVRANHKADQRPAAGRDEPWLQAAPTLSGPGKLNFDCLLVWQKQYMRALPDKGWRRGKLTRSEVEQGIIYRLVGKSGGASDDQIRAIADDYFARHRDEQRTRGDTYINRSLDAARRQHYEQGWITSSDGGWPRKRNAKFRAALTDELQQLLELVRGQLLAEWVAEVKQAGRSSSSAYRYKGDLVRAGLVEMRGPRIFRVANNEKGDS